MENFDFIEMKIPAKAEYVGVIRLSLSGIANRMGFSYEDIEDLKVSISEAITNAVTHAYKDGDQGEITIGFGVYENKLEIMVADHGGSFNIKKIKDDIGPYVGNESVEDLREGGFGLFLINALMDEVRINNNYGVIVLMTKYLYEAEVDIDDNQISTTQ
ncbi:anti-sigma B factor RsbW [Oceanobacillus zhaokaii]|jgi:serine/threonine-protein kinase RsbW|uniref:Serine-protein kinase RsbW n=1 Tax=Oceanobacillus zhaokaii TaxID=2052660 RepID=A0A345PDG5_9BACI|nr:anti-sigma B factor RsbW [Oceanobacillus zhaokaii]AXI08045.1 anti-sigma B factor RsbW [Oceanobacillus zhaokaii]